MKELGDEGIRFRDVRVKEMVFEAREGTSDKPVEVVVRFKEPLQLSLLDLEKLKTL